MTWRRTVRILSISSGHPIGPLTTRGSLGNTTLDSAILASLSAYVDYYQVQRGPVHLQTGVGLALANFTGSTVETLAPGPVAGEVDITKIGPLTGSSAYVGWAMTSAARGDS